MRENGVAPATADITALDEKVSHALRDAKVGRVDMNWYKRLPEWLRDPDLVLLDKEGELPTLILLLNQEPSKSNRIIVKLEYDLKKRGTFNILTTTQIVDRRAIKAHLGETILLFSKKEM